MNAILGGILIGIAASIMLLFNGRITGISGILGGILNKETLDKSWRAFFLFGLVLGGYVFSWFNPEAFTIISKARPIDYMIAGFLVGFGTLMGSGCTSGHGVCGISRFSIRSLIATITFIVSGILSVFIFKLLRGSL